MKLAKNSSRFIAAALMISLIAIACENIELKQPAVSHNETGNNTVSLITNLRKEGAKVETLGEAEQPFFSVKGTRIKVNGEDVQVFEYENEIKANQDASKVSKDGYNFGTIVIDWNSDPHFYKNGKLIALYIGKNEATIDLLEKNLGNQFAGAASTGIEAPKNKEKTIPTEKGDLTLSYGNGAATLSGMLSRSTPCVSWTAAISDSKDSPKSEVIIKIANKNKDVICVQVIGEPQDINAQIKDISEDTKYTIKIEGKTVFEGKIDNLNTDNYIAVKSRYFTLSKGQIGKIEYGTQYKTDQYIILNDILNVTDNLIARIIYYKPTSPEIRETYDIKMDDAKFIADFILGIDSIAKNSVTFDIFPQRIEQIK